MNFPNNPTGAVMGREDLEAVCEVLKRHDIIVVSDELYGELTYTENLTYLLSKSMACVTVHFNRRLLKSIRDDWMETWLCLSSSNHHGTNV